MKLSLTLAILLMFGVLIFTILSLQFPSPNSHQISGFVYLVQPDSITCGPTSTAMVLNRYGIVATVDQVKAKTKTQWFHYNGEAVGMTSPEYVPIALKHFGLPSKMMRGDLARLKYYVAQNKPCIVLLRSGEYYWHYVAVIGYDEQSIFVADPGSGCKEQLNNEAFEGSWSFQTDMRGSPTGSDWLVNLLRTAEVYPHTMVVPRIHIGSP